MRHAGHGPRICSRVGVVVPRAHDSQIAIDRQRRAEAVAGLDLRLGSNPYADLVSTYTIGEAAERSGFSASALRYYEGIGLVPPSTRTGAGYRLYDDDTLARLAFIARAKQLGCSLEEITDLVGIWDGQRCGPVQKRFHDLVTTKLADAERQIAELTALSDQLRQAAAHLAGPAIDGPCSEGCACFALDGALAPVALTTKPTR
jgi:MerR family transcriptional regulator, copper efflux regulator